MPEACKYRSYELYPLRWVSDVLSRTSEFLIYRLNPIEF